MARSPTRAWSGASGPGSRWGGSWPSSAARISTSVDLVQEFYDACRELETGSEETVQLAVLDGTQMTYLARHDGRQPVRLTSQIGRRLPASVTATGKAALASLDPDDVARRFEDVELPRLTRRSLPNVDALLADLQTFARAATRWTTRRPSRASSASASRSPAASPGEGPYAASITLLKARATFDRVPALIADLHRLSARLSDPLRAFAAR